MQGFQALLDELERLLSEIEELEPEVRDRVFRLLDGIDIVHRAALNRLGDALGEHALSELRRDPLVGWLFEAYSVGVDEREAAAAALEGIEEELGSAAVEVLGAEHGVVRVRIHGAPVCGTAVATRRIESALRARWPGFAAIEVEESSSRGSPVTIRRRRFADGGPVAPPVEDSIVRGICSGEVSDEAVESWLGALLEIPTEPMEETIREALRRLAMEEAEAQELFRKRFARTAARFGPPQLLRLTDTFERLGAEAGIPGGWR